MSDEKPIPHPTDLAGLAMQAFLAQLKSEPIPLTAPPPLPEPTSTYRPPAPSVTARGTVTGRAGIKAAPQPQPRKLTQPARPAPLTPDQAELMEAQREALAADQERINRLKAQTERDRLHLPPGWTVQFIFSPELGQSVELFQEWGPGLDPGYSRTTGNVVVVTDVWPTAEEEERQGGLARAWEKYNQSRAQHPEAPIPTIGKPEPWWMKEGEYVDWFAYTRLREPGDIGSGGARGTEELRFRQREAAEHAVLKMVRDDLEVDSLPPEEQPEERARRAEELVRTYPPGVLTLAYSIRSQSEPTSLRVSALVSWILGREGGQVERAIRDVMKRQGRTGFTQAEADAINAERSMQSQPVENVTEEEAEAAQKIADSIEAFARVGPHIITEAQREFVEAKYGAIEEWQREKERSARLMIQSGEFLAMLPIFALAGASRLVALVARVLLGGRRGVVGLVGLRYMAGVPVPPGALVAAVRSVREGKAVASALLAFMGWRALRAGEEALNRGLAIDVSTPEGKVTQGWMNFREKLMDVFFSLPIGWTGIGVFMALDYLLDEVVKDQIEQRYPEELPEEFRPGAAVPLTR